MTDALEKLVEDMYTLLPIKPEDARNLVEGINKSYHTLQSPAVAIECRDKLIEQQERTLKRYKKALEFYADENGYVAKIDNLEIEPTILIDGGNYAYEVLNEVKLIQGDDTVVIDIPAVEKWTLTALRYTCRKNKVKGYTKMSQPELVAAVKEVLKKLADKKKA